MLVTDWNMDEAKEAWFEEGMEKIVPHGGIPLFFASPWIDMGGAAVV